MLKEVNINTDMTVMEGHTTLAFVAIDENGERNFEFVRGGDGEYSFSSINTNIIKNKDIIHFGSATGFLDGELKNTYYKLLNHALDKKAFVSFDPNYRDALILEDRLEQFVLDCKNFIEKADFIKLSDEEIKIITKKEDLNEGVSELHKIGAKVVAITLGSQGTLISDGLNSVIIPSIKIKQVDSTGAGDAFVGAVLKKVNEIDNKDEISFEKWKEIIAYANRVGAITCTNYGAIDSIPTEKDLEG